MLRNAERIALAAFVAEAVLAGGNAVGVRFSNRELAPLWGAGLRFSLAAALLAGVMVVMRLAVPRGRALTGAVLSASSSAAPSRSPTTRSFGSTPGSARPCWRWCRSRPCSSPCSSGRSGSGSARS